MKKYLPVLLGLLVSGHAHAHYCSNIWVGPARLVVKPETATVHLTGTSTATLKVFLQNNFPYVLFSIALSLRATLA